MNELSKVTEGGLSAAGLRIAIVVSRFNSFITERLLDGAMDALRRSGGSPLDVEVIRIPGAWEFPVAVKAILATKKHDAVICLGAVIKGDTPHFDYVAGQSASGIAALALEAGIPVANGILTTNTVEQAIDRAGAKSGNKGADAAMTAIEMANLLKKLRAEN